jgi:adenylate kinase family enzyme
MKGFNFPVFKTRIDGEKQVFNLEDPVGRREYFTSKATPEIEKIKEYLEKGSFLAFLLGPKNSGKGTYSKLFAEAVGSDRIKHISVGDVVRSVHKSFSDEVKKKELIEYLEKNYRGFLPIEKAIEVFLGRDTSNLLPTEFILALLKREIDLAGKKAVFVDGFPRSLDQVSYSLFFRELMGYQDNPDIFIFIDVPETIIDERMKTRVICPKCQTPRNPKLLKTKEVGFDKEKNVFYLMCDNPICDNARMGPKEGDELGIEAVRNRIEIDKKVMGTLLELQGVPKIYLRNNIPVSEASSYVDEYEITPAYRYEFDEKLNKVNTFTEPWVINDEDDVPSYSLLPAAIVLSLIKQFSKILG